MLFWFEGVHVFVEIFDVFVVCFYFDSEFSFFYDEVSFFLESKFLCFYVKECMFWIDCYVLFL